MTPYRALWKPAWAVPAAFAWAGLFVWSPLYDGVDGGVLETGLAGMVLRAANAASYWVVARWAFRTRAVPVMLPLASTAFTTCLLHRAYWMVRLGGWRALYPSSTLTFGPLEAAISASILAALVARTSRGPSEETADRTTVVAAAWAAVYFNSSMCGLEDGFVIPTLVPLVALFVAIWRIKARRRWVTEVANGRHPDWRLVERNDMRTDGLPNLLQPSKRAAGSTQVLMRLQSPATNYREATSPEPVALVCMAGKKAR